MRRPILGRRLRWRIAHAVVMAAAAVALIGGFAFAFFTSTGSGTGTASVGSVYLSVNGPPATHSCSYGSLEPGDLTGAATCALSVTFTGVGPAWVSLTIAVQAKAGSGGTTLFDGSESSSGTGGNGLTFSISDGHNTYSVPAGAGAPCASPAGYTCWTTSDDLGAWYSGNTPSLSFTNGDSVTWTMTPQFPTSVTNPYQGGTATVQLSAQAVQSAGNSLPSSCNTSTIGQPCPASGSFSWS